MLRSFVEQCGVFIGNLSHPQACFDLDQVRFLVDKIRLSRLHPCLGRGVLCLLGKDLRLERSRIDLSEQLSLSYHRVIVGMEGRDLAGDLASNLNGAERLERPVGADGDTDRSPIDFGLDDAGFSGFIATQRPITDARGNREQANDPDKGPGP